MRWTTKGGSTNYVVDIGQSYGLCNGTRLIITKMRKYVLEENFLSRKKYQDKGFYT